MIKYDHVWCERNVFICENECKCKYWRWHSRYQIAIANYNMQKSIEFFLNLSKQAVLNYQSSYALRCSVPVLIRIVSIRSIHERWFRLIFSRSIWIWKKSSYFNLHIECFFAIMKKLKKSSFHFFYAPKTFTFTFIP
jgi:hypothetical protein